MTTNIRINSDRLWDSLMELAKIGATEKGGVRRLALTDLDKQARDLFVRWSKEAGCTIGVDKMGNIFARRPGKDDSLPPVMTGSHIDTQPSGGKFDGNYGVMAGLEVIRTLNDFNYETNRPIEVIVWTNEEGSRFAPAMIASGVYAGAFDLEYGLSRKDVDGKTIGEELQRIGYAGERECGGREVAAFFEAHIEQGPILEAEAKTIGVVTGVQGVRWYEAAIVGRESHAGTTPMPRRADAMVACARLALEVQKIALAYAPTAVGTVGRVEVEPNSPNVIPGVVRMTVDLRHHDDATLAAMEAEMYAAIARVAAGEKVQIETKKLHDIAAVRFHPDCVAAVRAAAAGLGHAHRDIISGAGHDAVHMSRITPSAMIFVPCKDGLSHNEAESATLEHCAAGAQVLLEAALAIDAKLGGR
jgi:beta-ureidopropionase / N-carbamoyl-L-amino-acid hydrolase